MKLGSYSTYDAKTHFSELLDKVAARRRIIIRRRGKPVAMLVPLPDEVPDLEAHLAGLEAEGLVDPPRRSRAALAPVVRRPGALRRFLAGRD